MDTFNIQSLKDYSLEDSSLRSYQQENKQKIYDAWGYVNSVMLQMPTGTGKTRLFVSVIKDFFNYSRDNRFAIKVLILVHRTELIEQISNELGIEYNLAHGIIQSGDKERKKYPIQLASVQTLSRRLDNWSNKNFDVIIVDEAHHITANSYQKIIKAFPGAKLLGVTATPVRLNGEGFTDTFEKLIISPSVKSFIEHGYLSKYDYYSVAHSSEIQKEIDGIKKFSQGDYAEQELERVCDNDRVRAQVVKAYLDYANGKKGIVYTINKQHNKNLCEEFKEKGISCVAIDSDTPKDLREKYIEDFRNGKYSIICNVNLFSEGFDCPDIEFIQLARPTKSLALYLQQVGRGLRISENKEKTLFLDNVGLYNRFGFPSSRRMWQHHFDGKYIGNKTEEEVEQKKEQIDLNNVFKRERKQNIEEGKEKIFLIQTTDEIQYLKSRKEQFLNWLIDYAILNTTSYQSAFDNIKQPGLMLSRNKDDNVLDFLFQSYHIKLVEETPEIRKSFLNETFYDWNNKCFRKYKDIGEYLSSIDTSLQINKLENIKQEAKKLAMEFKNLNFSESELSDIIPDIIESKWSTSIHPKDADAEVIPYIGLVLNCIYDLASCGKKYQNIFSKVTKISIDYTLKDIK